MSRFQMFVQIVVIAAIFRGVHGSLDCVLAFAKCRRIPDGNVNAKEEFQCLLSQKYVGCMMGVPASCVYNALTDQARKECVEKCTRMRIPVTDDCKPETTTTVTSLLLTNGVSMTTIAPKRNVFPSNRSDKEPKKASENETIQCLYTCSTQKPHSGVAKGELSALLFIVLLIFDLSSEMY